MVGWHRHVLSTSTCWKKSGKQQLHSCQLFHFSIEVLSASRFTIPFTRSACSTNNCLQTFTLYHHFQQLGFTSTRRLLSSDATAGPSPLTPTLAIGSGQAETEKAVSKPSKVQAILKNIKQSPKKVNLVATLIRGMCVEDALLQLQLTVKCASKTVYQVIHSARANATHNHGFDADRLIVAEAFVSKGLFKKRVLYHAKGRSGVRMRPECRLTVVLREITPEEEAEIARLKVNNFTKLTRRERRLVPHKLIETTPIWNRKGKGVNCGDHAAAMAA